MNIGVTGHDGFIGEHVMAALAADPAFQVRIFKGDIADPAVSVDFVRDLDAIVHLAGANRASDREILAVNTFGVFNMLQAMRSANPRARLVLSSSFQVYTQWGNAHAIDESTPPSPVAIYGVSKKFAEELCARYCADHGMEAVILRLSNVFGPGCKPDYNSVIATCVDRALSGRPMTIHGDGSSRRDYIFVRDVVSAIVRSTTIPLGDACAVYNVCSGAMRSLNDIVSAVNGAVESPMTVEYRAASRTEPVYDPCSNEKALRDGVLEPPLSDFDAAIAITVAEEKKRRTAASS